MYLLLVSLIVLAALLLCFIVMIQNSKGGGLASGFSSSNQIMGVRKTTDVLEKTTWGLAGFIVVLSIASAYTLPRQVNGGTSVIQERALQEERTNPLNPPVGFETPSEAPIEVQTQPAEVESAE